MSAQVHVAPASVSTLRHLNLAWPVSGTFPQLTQITGFHSLIIRAGRYQEPVLASAVWCHMLTCVISIPTLTSDPGRGHISNLNRLYGHRINCPWPYLNFKAMMLRPFFNRSGSPRPMVGRPCDQARPPGQLVTRSWWPLSHPATVGDLSLAPDITMFTILSPESENVFQF